MKKRMLSILLALVMVLGMLPVTAAAATADMWDGNAVATAFAGGTGTASNPYQIATCAQLNYLAQLLESDNEYSNGTNLNTYGKSCYKLTSDLNMGGYAFDGIKNFYGVFDGNGHTVSGLNISGKYHVGFFGYAENTTIKNLTLYGVVGGGQSVGALVGGIGGGTISNCKNYCTVYYSAPKSVYAVNFGGLVGRAAGTTTITQCYNYGEVNGSNYAGGIVGFVDDTHTNKITTPYVKITYCANLADVNGRCYTGGIAGGMDGGMIECCGNAGYITATSQNGYSDSFAGGIVGEMNEIEYEPTSGSGQESEYAVAVLRNCYNTGNVMGYENRVAGVAGRIAGTWKNLYNIGRVTTTTTTKETGEISYWTTQKTSTGLYYLSGVNTGLSNNVVATALSDSEMKTQGSFSGYTFSSSYWGWDTTGQYFYPIITKLGPLTRVYCDHTYGSPVWKWFGSTYSGYSAVVTLTCQKDRTHMRVVQAKVVTTETEPTCTDAGKTVYAATATLNGQTYTQSKSEITSSATGHSYGEPTWSWAADYSSATATFTCTKGDDTQTVTDSSIDSVTDNGDVTYTATVTFENKEYTDTKEVTHTHSFTDKASNQLASEATCTKAATYYVQCDGCDDVTMEKTVEQGDPTGHSYGEPTWSWAADYSSATATFTCTKGDDTQTVTDGAIDSATANGDVTYTATVTFENKEYTDTKEVLHTHSFTDKASNQLASEATCTKAATYYVQCDGCDDVTMEKTVEQGDPAGHSYGEPTWSWAADYSSATATFTCTKGDDTQTVTDGAIDSATANGDVTYTATVTFENKEYTDTKEVLHTHSYTDKASNQLASEATCTKAATYYVQCDGCDDVTMEKTVEQGNPTGHSYGEPTWSWAADYSSATATFTCTKGDDTQTVTDGAIDSVTDNGDVTYTATVTFENKEYTDTKSVELHIHCVCNTANCQEHGEIEWIAWKNHETLPTTSGNYYLTEDVGITGTFVIQNADIKLCLNGYTVKPVNDPQYDMTGFTFLEVGQNARLTVTDCSNQECYGTIDKTTGQWTATEKSDDCNLTGGVIINPEGLGIGIERGGVLTMYGGNIAGCSHGAVKVGYDSSFELHGGTLIGSIGAVRLTRSSMTMTGGKITNISGTAVSIGDGAALTMTGGEISKSTEGVAGTGTLIVSGKPQITENTTNVKLYSGKTITIGGALTGGAQIGINMTNPDTFTSGWPTYMGTDNGKSWFTSDQGKEILVDTNGELMLMHSTHAYTYTVNAAGDTVTESCTCGHSATAKLAVDPQADLTYTGNGIEPVSIEYSDNWAGDKTAAVSYENNTGAGQATAKATVEEKELSVTFEIGQATPDYTVPGGLSAEYGDKLSDVELPDGWEWDEPDTAVGSVGENRFKATFTPEDTANYKSVTVEIPVTVEQATPDYTAPGDLSAEYGDKLSDVELPDGWEWVNPDTAVDQLGQNKFEAIYTPNDPNYKSVTVELTVTVTKAAQEAPDAPELKRKSANSITVKTEDGMEYSIDGVNWQTSGTFKGLKSNTRYTVYARVAETDTHFASPASEGLEVTTLRRSSGANTPTYPPRVEKPEGGSVTVTPEKPEAGDEVTIRPRPDAGKEVEDVIVTDKNGNKIPVTDNGDGSFGFIQPDSSVTITVLFGDAGCDGTGDCPTLSYRDLDVTQWYHEATDFVLEKGLMNGVGENRFDPAGTTSRAMVVTILWRLEGCPVVNYLMQFEDVPAETWYTEAVRWAAAERIVTGYGAAFGPEDNITREQLATILYRYEQYKGGGFTGMWMFLLKAADRDQISDWAYEAMCWMTMNGIINGKGDGILDPQGSATRVEVAQMLMNYIQNTK